MPVRVNCPAGCQISVPSNRIGKMVRCPECKQIIRLSAKVQVRESGRKVVGAEKVETAEPDFSIRLEGDDDASTSRAKLQVPDSIQPTSVRRKSQSERDSKRPSHRSVRPQRKKKLPSLSLHDLEPEQTDPSLPAINDPMRTTSGIKRRVNSATADRIMISKFFASCLVVVAAVNIAPAAYYWIQWSQTFESDALPRWIYLQCFLAALHLIYAIFLVQIKDWSALFTVAIAMLAVAVVFAAVSAGLLTGGGQGVIAQFLEIPHVLISQASIWCVAMLCLATMMCYIGGKVAVNWKRTEQLLREIVT